MLAGGESTMGSGYGQAGALMSKIQNSVIGSTIGGREQPSPWFVYFAMLHERRVISAHPVAAANPREEGPQDQMVKPTPSFVQG
jgi:hypothetical protein